MITNFSNLLEGGYLASPDITLFRELLACEQLLIAGERPSMAEFLESRRHRYGFDSERYPMYFKSDGTTDLEPVYVRTGSATQYLEQQIGAIARHEMGLRNVLSHTPDINLITEVLPNLSGVVTHRESSAITRSLLAGKFGSESHEAATSRLISTLYIKQHLEEFRCDIATGLRPLSVFERLGSGDHARDAALLYAVLSGCGIDKGILTQGGNDRALANLRGTGGHEQFVLRLAVLCRSLGNYLVRKHSISEMRAYARNVLAVVGHRNGELKVSQSLYDEADQSLAHIVGRLRSADKSFAAEFEKQVAQTHTGPVVLLVTATKVETQALLKVAEEQGVGRPQFVSKDRYVALELGWLNSARLIAVQCEPGSVGPSAAQAVIGDAISDFKPKAVILGGIAFGAKPDKQKLGDVLLSKMVVEYERAKIKEGVTIPRSQRIESSPKLLSVFRAAEATWRDTPVHVGTLLTGEKLIDDKPFVTGLLKLEPEAIGGEMEGAGLVAAAERAKVDWIIAKAIVDWGYEKSTSSSDAQQYGAARSAFLFVFWALSKVGI